MSRRDPHTFGLSLNGRLAESDADARDRLAALERGAGSTLIVGGSGTVGDATTAAKGKLKLSNDLAGTADAPIVLRSTRVFNVKDPPYNALGNDAADDTAAIQAAIDAAYATSSLGGEVFFPPGIYRFTNLRLKGRVKLRGAHRYASTLRVVTDRAPTNLSTNDYAITSMMTADGAWEPVIEDLRLIGPGANTYVVKTVTGMSGLSTTTPTINATAHGLTAGDRFLLVDVVTTSGANIHGVNGQWVVNTAAADSFTFHCRLPLYGDAATDLSYGYGVANGAGTKIRITTRGAHGLNTGESVTISGATPAGANGTWTITRIDRNRFDLDGSTYTTSGGGGYAAWAPGGAYTSGGTVIDPTVNVMGTNVQGTLERVAVNGFFAGVNPIDHCRFINCSINYNFYSAYSQWDAQGDVEFKETSLYNGIWASFVTNGESPILNGVMTGNSMGGGVYAFYMEPTPETTDVEFLSGSFNSASIEGVSNAMMWADRRDGSTAEGTGPGIVTNAVFTACYHQGSIGSYSYPNPNRPTTWGWRCGNVTGFYVYGGVWSMGDAGNWSAGLFDMAYVVDMHLEGLSATYNTLVAGTKRLLCDASNVAAFIKWKSNNRQMLMKKTSAAVTQYDLLEASGGAGEDLVTTATTGVPVGVALQTRGSGTFCPVVIEAYAQTINTTNANATGSGQRLIPDGVTAGKAKTSVTAAADQIGRATANSNGTTITARLGGMGGGGSVIDATTADKGKLKLAGALEGTADIPKLRKGTSTDHGALGVFDLRDFGATEGTDCLAALNAAQTAMPSYGGVLYVPLNQVGLSAVWTMTKPIKLVGLGVEADIFDTTPAKWDGSTRFIWTGADGGTMMALTPLLKGWGFDGFVLDGGDPAGNDAARGFSFDCAQYGDIGTLAVMLQRAGAVAYDFHCDSANVGTPSINDNTAHINAGHLIALAPVILKTRGYVDGTTEIANTCHVEIDQIDGQFGLGTSAEHGIQHRECDNIEIGQTYLKRAGGATGFGVELGSTTANLSRARSVTYRHLQPEGGVVARAPSTVGTNVIANRIVYYDRENGQPAPTVEAGAQLDWREGGRNAAGSFTNVGAASGSTSGPSPRNTGFFTHKVQGTTGAEYFVETRSALSDATVEVVGKDATPSSVRARIYARGNAAQQIEIGSITNHPVHFFKNNASIFQLNATGHLQLASGKRIGWNVDPNAAIVLPETGTPAAAHGIWWGNAGDRGVMDMGTGILAWPSLNQKDEAGPVVLKLGGPLTTTPGTTNARMTWTGFSYNDGYVTSGGVGKGNGLRNYGVPQGTGASTSADGLTVTLGASHGVVVGDYIYLAETTETLIGFRKVTATGATTVTVDSVAPATPFPVSLTGKDWYVSDRTNMTDSGNISGAFWGASIANVTFDARGSFQGHTLNMTTAPYSGWVTPEPSVYGENFGFYVSNTINRKGAFAGIAEYALTVNDTATSGAGPAKVAGLSFQLKEYNTFASYNNTAIFPTGSRWIKGGAAAMTFVSGGTYEWGTGLLFAGSAAFKRIFVLENAAGTETTCLDGLGNLGLGTVTDQTSTIPAKLSFGAATTAAGGINFGADVELFRGASNWLRLNDNLGINTNAGGSSLPQGSAAIRSSGIFEACNASGAVIRNYVTTGDTQPAWRITAPGLFEIGPGGAGALDVSFGRVGVNSIATLTSSAAFRTAAYWHIPVAKTAAYTMGAGDNVVIADATTGAFTVTLPAAANTGQEVHIKRINLTNNVTVDAAGVELIDTALTKVLGSQYAAVHLISDGTSWHMLNSQGTVT